MTKFSVKKPFTIFVAVVAVIVFGIISYRNMTPDLLPNMDFPYVIVVTTYPGATPEQVETTVTKPMEQSLATLNSLEGISSTSSANYSMVMLEFEQEASMDSIMVDMLQSMQTLSESWDDGVGTPYILRINPSMIPVSVAAVDREGMDRYELAQFTEDTLIPALEGTTGVASITSGGLVERTLTVALREDLLKKTNERVAAAINKQLADAKEELDEAQTKLDDSRAELDDGSAQLTYAQKEASKKIGEGSLQLDQTIAQFQAYSAQLTAAQAQKTALETEKSAYEENIATLQSTIELCDTSIGQLEGVLAALELFPDDTIADTLPPELAAALKAQGYTTVGEAEAGMSATLEEAKGGKATAEAALAELQAVADARLPQITQDLASLGTEILVLQSIVDEFSAAVEQMNSGYTAMQEGSLSASVEMATAAAKIASAQTALEEAQKTLDNAFDTYDEQVETALKAAELDKVLTLETLSMIIGAQNFDMPAGYVYKDDGIRVVVTVGDKIAGVDDLRELVLMDLGIDDLDPIRVSDVAEIVTADNADSIYATLNGNDGIILMFSKQSNYATAKVSDNINAKFDKLCAEYEGLEFTQLMDQGDYIYLMRDSILSSLLWGALFSVIVLFLFLRDWRPTLITLFSIPISLLFAITLMYFTGVTINMMSLSGLAISVGMLVDNSVVVIENTYRLRALGENPMKAAVSGAGQVAGAVAASTLTTVCVFVPILFTNGMARQIFTDMMLTLSFALLASLIIALTLVPAMSGTLLRNMRQPKETFFSKLQPAYRKSVRWAVGHKAIVLILALALFGGSGWAVLSKGLNFLPTLEMEQMIAYMSMPEDSTFAETKEMATEVAERILSVDGVGTVGGMISQSSSGMGGMSLDSLGDVSYYILLDENTKRRGKAISDDIAAACADLDCEVEADSGSLMATYTEMLSGSGITVRLYGSELHELQEAAKLVAQNLSEVEGVISTDTGIVNPSPELHFTVDKAAAAKNSLTVAQVYQQVALALTGKAELMELRDDSLTYEVSVTTRDEEEITPEYLQKLTFTVTDKMGEEKTVRLRDVASFEWTETLSTINRINQRRHLDVTAEIDENYNVTLVTDAAEKHLKGLELPYGITTEFAGERETIMDAMEDLVVLMLVGILLVYLVMVAQFQNLKSPFIVMFTIPLAFTGGFIAMLISGMEINVLSMLGLIMLVGIIVNNGIVLVDYINQLRAGGMERVDAIEDAAVTRLRPILMTTITTILGLVVMALGRNEATSLIQPLAITTIGGLTYATLMTLYVVPVMYDILSKKEIYKVDEADLELSDK